MIHTLTIIRFCSRSCYFWHSFAYKKTVPLHAKLHVEDGSI